MIYKFIGLSNELDTLDRLRQIVEDNTVYAASATDFNDPFELKVDYSWEATEAELRAKYFSDHPGATDESCSDWLTRVGEPGWNWWTQQMNRGGFTSQFGLTCFSLDRANLLLWSHYAAQHQGCCVAIAPDAVRAADEHFASGPVVYQDEAPRFDYVHDSLDHLVKSVFFHKASAWAYEGEYRAVFEKQGAIPLPAGSVKGVYLGCRAYGALRRYAQDHFGNPDIRFVQMTEDFGAYRVHERPLVQGTMHMSSFS